MILPGGGILRPTICVDGRFVGTWSQKKTKKKLDVTLEPFDRVDERWMPAIEAEAADIGAVREGEGDRCRWIVGGAVRDGPTPSVWDAHVQAAGRVPGPDA